MDLASRSRACPRIRLSSSPPALRVRICPPCTGWRSAPTSRWTSLPATGSLSPLPPFPATRSPSATSSTSCTARVRTWCMTSSEGLHVSGHACQEELKIVHATGKAQILHPRPRRAAAFAAPRQAGAVHGHESPERFIIGGDRHRHSSSPARPARSTAPSPPGVCSWTAAAWATWAAWCCGTASILRRTA